MNLFRACGVAGFLLVVAGCGGGGSYGGNAPTPPPPPAASATTIRIVADSGSQAFDPNPAPLPDSRRVAWQNSDSVVHRIVANDGSFDTGNIGPGASSAAVEVPAAGTRFHCTLHPTMVGAVAGGSGNPPPCTGLYC